MNSLFAAVPFRKFELGRYAMGQGQPRTAVPAPVPPPTQGAGPNGCPVGTLPMRMPNGSIICSKYSPASAMFMPTVGQGGNVGYGPAMGQAGMPEPYLKQAERDQLLLQIQDGVQKVKAMENFINWGAVNDPGFKKFFGMDASRFTTLAGKIAPLYQTVADMADRLSQTDAEYWYRPSDQEMADIKQWVVGASEMYKIYAAHPTPASPLPYGTVPPPPFTPASSGAPTGTALTTKDYVVGAAMLAGIGGVLYALMA